MDCVCSQLKCKGKSKHYAIKTIQGSGGVTLPFLTSALDGNEWTAHALGKSPPHTHWIGGWMGPRAGLDVGPAGVQTLAVQSRPHCYTN